MKRVYTSAVVGRARQLVLDGHCIAEVQRIIEHEHGRCPAIGTIRTWSDAGYAARRREQWAESQRTQRAKRRDDPATRLMRRMRALRDAGISYRSVAAVVRADTGIDLSEDEVRYALKFGRPPRKFNDAETWLAA